MSFQNALISVMALARSTENFKSIKSRCPGWRCKGCKHEAMDQM